VIRTQKLTPYNIDERTGELKYIIVMTTADGSQGILRFVLRSSEAIPRITKSIQGIQQAFPWVKVISCNLQPQPAAILEGPEEILLTRDRVIREQFGEIPLYLAPQSFMQVTPQVAQSLYTHAARYIERTKPSLVMDLFCGVGGFSLHAASHAQRVVGVELSVAAIESARISAAELKLENTEFHASDVEKFLTDGDEFAPDLVIVNPPRRGLSPGILEHIKQKRPKVLLYSSCAPDTFARDAQILAPTYRLDELTPFDMFPMTRHCELLGAFTLAA
jgi:23S rRNA (uracil747-C5)-methyltransferase